MMKILKCNREEYPVLTGIWERSVRATHDFLTEDVISDIKRVLASDYFPQVELYGAVTDDGRTRGFIGILGDRIEMLFVDSDSLRHGYGSALVDFAIGRGAVKVDVNEQNPSATKFYNAKGFAIESRDATDEAGRPYPILHLSLMNRSSGTTGE